MTGRTFFTEYASPLGPITLVATEAGLCGLYFEGHKHPPVGQQAWIRDEGARFDGARKWLSVYFEGQNPGRVPTLVRTEGTDFQKRVWSELIKIPPGETMTYAHIAEAIGSPNAVRAVGAAIGRNPLSILVPCHRVVGSNGSLTGYAGGVDRKRWLLDHEAVIVGRVH